MKELSIEDKAKAYDEALQRTRKWYDSNTNKGFRGIFEDIFPELAASKDEEIKKEIKVILANTDLSQFALDYTFADMLNWLEKQGEYKYTQKDIDDAYLKGIADVKYEVEKQNEKNKKMKKEIAEFIFNSKEYIKDRYDWIKCLGYDIHFIDKENQGEQNPTDKAEPKFRNGQWITIKE